MDTSKPAAGRGWALAGIGASALLLGGYARGGSAWPLGFVALLPWLLVLDQVRSWRGALASAALLGMAFVATAFAWFGAAIAAYTGGHGWASTLLLCLLAPLLQPQLLAFALLRHAVRRHGALLGAVAGAAAWVACEWAWPKLLGDTLGHGLQPATELRQLADLGGAAGLTLLLLLVNEALALVVVRYRAPRTAAWPLAVALLLPALAWSYGSWRLARLQPAADAAPVAVLRIGMVQSSIVDYDRLRRELGAYAVVRQVLDTHFGLSGEAIERHGADVLLWPETVYPTTFGQPRSTDGAAFDREILDFVAARGVPLVFGTYDRDADGEYNAAAFVDPQRGLLGFYRKTHPFPLTEHVPGWLDGPLLRRWLPWAGSWQRGNGARVLPLRTVDGRELNVVPLICLDAVRPEVAIAGARLGAQAIVTLSNDGWFSSAPQGARLHLAVAAFRSIETRLPQFRATSNGLSAIIDPSGAVLAQTGMGDQAVLVGALPILDPPPTLMLRWGDWLGGAALLFLGLLLPGLLLRHWRGHAAATLDSMAATPSASPPSAGWSAPVLLLTPGWRAAIGALQLGAALGLAGLALRMLLHDGWQVNSLLQLQLFGATVLAPWLAAWALRRSRGARARIEAGHLLLEQRRQRIEIPLARIALLHAWRCPLPGAGVQLQFESGRHWQPGIAVADPLALLQALVAAGAAARLADPASGFMAGLASLRAATRRRWLDHPLLKFVLFPLLPALPAFRLHQYIAFGGTFGEWQTYGAAAWASGLLIWWAAWALGLLLFAGGLRLLIEAASVAALYWHGRRALLLRTTLEWLGRGLYYLGVPAWLLLRIVLG